MIEYTVWMRWPLWFHGDIGIVIRQSLQFIFGGEGTPIQCHEKGFTVRFPAPTGKVREAVEYANKCVEAAFPSLVKEYGYPCGEIEEGALEGDADGL